MATSQDATEQMFDRALEIADKHLDSALRESVELAPYVAVAMIEAAVNQATEMTSPEDVVAMLQDLLSQIENEIDDGGIDDGEGEGDGD